MKLIGESSILRNIVDVWTQQWKQIHTSVQFYFKSSMPKIHGSTSPRQKQNKLNINFQNKYLGVVYTWDAYPSNWLCLLQSLLVHGTCAKPKWHVTKNKNKMPYQCALSFFMFNLSTKSENIFFLLLIVCFDVWIWKIKTTSIYFFDFILKKALNVYEYECEWLVYRFSIMPPPISPYTVWLAGILFLLLMGWNGVVWLSFEFCFFCVLCKESWNEHMRTVFVTTGAVTRLQYAGYAISFTVESIRLGQKAKATMSLRK